MRRLLTIPVLLILCQNLFYGQEIIRVVGRDGKKYYANTEEIFREDLSFTAGLKGNGLKPAELRSSQYIESMIHTISEQEGVDPELVKAVAKVESNYNPNAISHKGARGLMQLLPETARRFGVINVFDARQNIEGGVKFLKFLMTIFPNNLPYILAAYNAGENAVLKYRGIPPYRETQAYVRRITSLYAKKWTLLTARNEPEGGIVRYQDEVGRVVYSNLDPTFQ